MRRAAPPVAAGDRLAAIDHFLVVYRARFGLAPVGPRDAAVADMGASLKRVERDGGRIGA